MVVVTSRSLPPSSGGVVESLDVAEVWLRFPHDRFLLASALLKTPGALRLPIASAAAFNQR
jgi:hypothetical protein